MDHYIDAHNGVALSSLNNTTGFTQTIASCLLFQVLYAMDCQSVFRRKRGGIVGGITVIVRCGRDYRVAIGPYVMIIGETHERHHFKT